MCIPKREIDTFFKDQPSPSPPPPRASLVIMASSTTSWELRVTSKCPLYNRVRTSSKKKSPQIAYTFEAQAPSILTISKVYL